MACRVLYNLRKYDYVTANMRNLHWLRIHKCITYKFALLMFKIIKKGAPKYICDLVTCNSTTKHQLRSASTSTFKPMFCKSTLSLNSSFASVGPQTWNGLPSDIRNESDEETFKKKLISPSVPTVIRLRKYTVQCDVHQQRDKWINITLLD